MKMGKGKRVIKKIMFGLGFVIGYIYGTVLVIKYKIRRWKNRCAKG